MLNVETIAGKTIRHTAEQVANAGQIRRLAKRGAMWVTLTSVAAIPMTYYRNWILGQIGEAGEVVGTYAVILLFCQIVGTFVLFGGSSVVSSFLPKIRRDSDKAAFLSTYSLISLLSVTAFVALMHWSPTVVSFLIRRPVDPATLGVFCWLAPIALLSQLVVFALTGLIQFRLSSILSQMQVFLVCIFGTVAYFQFPGVLRDHAVVLLAIPVAAANVAVIVIGFSRLARSVSLPITRWYLPAGFWKFSGFVHLNTISTFAFQSIDQFLVLAALGTRELGAYFVLWQCARLITFVPQRIGQVLLASFSHLAASGNQHELHCMHAKLCRIILLLSTPLALAMVLCSYQIAGIFGAWFGERHLYLLLLAMVVHCGSLGSLNSMIVMAKERTGLFFLNSVVLITLQLTVTLLLLDDLGVYAVIAGKAVGTISGQIGLFSMVRWKLEGVSLRPGREYWISLAVVLGAGAVSLRWNPLPLVWAAPALGLLIGAFFAGVRFRPSEILALMRRAPRLPISETC